MNMTGATADDFLAIGPRVRVMPIIHGSGDFAVQVREELLSRPYDCVAVPLPPSFQEDVEAAIQELPRISIVVQVDAETEEDEGEAGFSYVPIDPCQGVIAALRTARGERIAREFIDLETPRFVAITGSFPDPYALKRVSPRLFSAALLYAIPRPFPGQNTDRIHWMASRLRELESRYRSILLVCSILDWPWIREAYASATPPPEQVPFFAPILSYPVDPRNLIFALGELPYITSLYERGRSELLPDDNLSVDGIKEMVLDARKQLAEKHPRIAERITPQLLSIYFRYIRNLSLLDRRLTPDFYSLIVAAQQTAGDDFALALAETARSYPCAPSDAIEGQAFDLDEPRLARLGINRGELPDWGTGPMVNRLPGQALSWRVMRAPAPATEGGTSAVAPALEPVRDVLVSSRGRPDRELPSPRARPGQGNPGRRPGPHREVHHERSRRHRHPRDAAELAHGRALCESRASEAEARSKLWSFSSIYRPTPRCIPTERPGMPSTLEESTLAFYATDPMKNLVGPGIAQAEYGGALFIFPPRPIPDIWTDRRLDFTDTLEHRLLAAAFLHSNDRHVAVVSPKVPAGSWRRLARRFGKKIVHLPLKRFGGQLLERLRTFHVLNGRQVRSYAADYIRDL